MNKYILNIETSGKNCSVALSNRDELLKLNEIDSDNFVHSEQLHLLIEQTLKELDILPKDLSAVAVSSGPGSYTGLRIGVAAAKGISYALGVPLIAVPSLLVLANAAKTFDADLLVPMMDARRMEVYSAIYDMEMQQLKEEEAVIVENGFLSDYSGKKIAVFGDGAEKCLELLPENCSFIAQIYSSAQYMVSLSADRFQREEFVDMAYFEPNYLKEFQAGKPKKMF